MKETNKYFKTNVLLKNIIGKELINDDNFAILELIKNSYDAGSNTVNISFKNIKLKDENLDKNDSKIVIQDFGMGMNGDDIENKWLNIAYSEKKNKREYNGRMLAGAKGVGRFSCDRLGRYLNLYTRKIGKKIYHLNIDWNDFEIENEQELEIQSIPVRLQELTEVEFITNTPYEIFDQGTILEISSLRERWTDYDSKKQMWTTDKLFKLKKNLEKLLNPNQAFSKDSFVINLFAKEFLEYDKLFKENHFKINGKVDNVIFDKLNFTSTSISAEIDNEGKVIKTTLTDKGRDIFILKEKNQFKDLKNINIVLYYLNTYSKIYFAKQTGIRSVNFGSVFLFINGFRIPPYGDEGDDWLGIENRKGQGYARNLGARELIGRIEVIDNENKFKIVSSREGLVKDDNYITLTDKFFYSIFRRLERFVVEGLDWDRLTKKNKKNEDYLYYLDSDLTAKDIAANFEKNVNDPNWRFEPSQEKYYETQAVKDRRILSLIDNIINLKKENIIDLFINEDLINELISSEQQRATEVLNNLFAKISEMPVSSDTILAAFKETERINSDLNATLKPILNSLILNDETQSIIIDYKNKTAKYEKDVDNLRSKIEILQKQYEQIEIEKEAAEKKIDEVETENIDLQERLDIEKQKNTYLLGTRKIFSPEAEFFVHDIKVFNYSLLQGITNLLGRINDDDFSTSELLSRITDIKIDGEKSMKLAQLINHVNFPKDAERQTIDIVEYTNQYIDRQSSIFSDYHESKKMSFVVVSNNIEFFRKVSVLDFSIILDNMIGNSNKWGATKIEINFSKENGVLKLIFSDNGAGLVKKFIDRPESIFELGVFATPISIGAGSSGVGLYAVKKLLNEMKADIQFLGNNIRQSGASFELTFK